MEIGRKRSSVLEERESLWGSNFDLESKGRALRRAKLELEP
jgi:hypothetical protein